MKQDPASWGPNENVADCGALKAMNNASDSESEVLVTSHPVPWSLFLFWALDSKTTSHEVDSTNRDKKRPP
jgi:hypothetical protein